MQRTIVRAELGDKTEVYGTLRKMRRGTESLTTRKKNIQRIKDMRLQNLQLAEMNKQQPEINMRGRKNYKCGSSSQKYVYIDGGGGRKLNIYE